MARLDTAGTGVLAAGATAVLGRWVWHWHDHPAVAVAATVALGALVFGLLIGRMGALATAAAACLFDALLVLRAWSAHLPLHCHCVRLAGAPALLGWGGIVIVADAVVVALAISLGRRHHRSRRWCRKGGSGAEPGIGAGHGVGGP